MPTNHNQQDETRRRLTARLVLLAGGAVIGLAANAQSPQKEVVPSKRPTGNAKRTSLHQEILFRASPSRLYEILLSSEEFAAFSGMKANIEPTAGGAFSMFKGLVAGRNVELILNQRIVQAWRLTEEFPAGVFSLVKFEFTSRGEETLVVLEHTGFPEGHYDHLYSGWYARYWDPLHKFLT